MTYQGSFIRGWTDYERNVVLIVNDYRSINSFLNL